MITVEPGTYRFYNGDNITYRDATTQWLFEQSLGAGDVDMRTYAAAGLMRALLDFPREQRNVPEYHTSINWSTDVILKVLAGEQPVAPESEDVRTFVEELPPVNGVFDATSMAATKANKPAIIAGVINERIPAEDPKLVIALGHGGILSSAATFSALSGDNVFYPVRFSRHKSKDDSPQLSESEIAILAGLSESRAVVIHDEDGGPLGGGGTMLEAINYVNATLGISAIGITPVTGRHPSSLSPELTWQQADGRFAREEYTPWSEKLGAIKAKIAA